MNKNGPIVIIEDDTEDQEILAAALKDLAVKNEVVFFNGGESAYKFLVESKEQPFPYYIRYQYAQVKWA